MDLVVIDCQNDFIDGTMACEFANEAVDNIIEYFKDDMNVYYTSDFHPINHMSFKDQGGPWPSHCVEGTIGAEIHDKFHDSHQIPFSMNIDFDAVIKALKTIEYSGYFTLECGEYLNKFDKDNVHLGLRDMANAVKKLSEMYENL